MVVLRLAVWEKSEFVTRGPCKLAKQPNNCKTVAHIINPGEITQLVHATDLAWHLLFCQDHRVCELRKKFSFLFVPFFEDFSAAQPFFLQQVNNQLVHDFLSQQNTRLFLFLSERKDIIVAGRDQSADDQPNNLAEGRPYYTHWLFASSQAISRTTWLNVTPILL